MAGVDPHEFAAGLGLEFDVERVADDKRLEEILVRGLYPKLCQDELPDALEWRYRRVVRGYRFGNHFAHALEHRFMDQLVLGIEIEVDGALGYLRFLGDAINRGSLHAVTSHHAACGFEDLANAIFLDYLFFVHGKNWTVSQMNVRSV